MEIVIVAIVFGSLIAIVKLILDFVQAKHGISQGGLSNRSLTTSELTSMIDGAVSESAARLEKRIEHLEAIVVDEPIGPGLLLEEPREPDLTSAPQPTDRQKSRS